MKKYYLRNLEMPVSIDRNIFRERISFYGTSFFTKEEFDTIVNLLESNGRENLNEEDWDMVSLEQKSKSYHLGLTFFEFCTDFKDGTNPFAFYVSKSKEGYYYVNISEVDWYGDDGEYEEYFECDGFGSLMYLLIKEAKLSSDIIKSESFTYLKTFGHFYC